MARQYHTVNLYLQCCDMKMQKPELWLQHTGFPFGSGSPIGAVACRVHRTLHLTMVKGRTQSRACHDTTAQVLALSGVWQLDTPPVQHLGTNRVQVRDRSDWTSSKDRVHQIQSCNFAIDVQAWAPTPSPTKTAPPTTTSTKTLGPQCQDDKCIFADNIPTSVRIFVFHTVANSKPPLQAKEGLPW